ncbi:MAG: MCE family protein [Chitinophagaceae bacterium]|nr:MCE family protein [Chitinophagaceae bacterium]
MKSNNNKRAVIVGIFILIGIAIFIAAVLTLGSQHKTFEKSVNVKVFFDDVNGLQKGNNVWFNGVKIGTIKKVAITSNQMVEVDMGIEEKSIKFIRKDAKAKVSSDGLIGNKIVVIYGGTLQSPVVDKDFVLATEKLRNTEEMINTLEKNNENLLDITGGFKTITKRITDGQGTIGKLLTDESLINQLNATANTFKKASANIEQLSLNMSAYSSKLNNKGSIAHELVSDTILYSRLQSAVTQFQAVSVTSQGIVDNLKEATTQLNNGMNNKNSPVGVLLNDEQSAANIKAILNNLNGGSKKLDEDLEAVQHNFLLKHFFKVKAKKEAADSAKKRLN